MMQSDVTCKDVTNRAEPWKRQLDPRATHVEHLFKTLALKVVTAIAGLEVALDHTGRDNRTLPYIVATVVVVSAPSADGYLYLRARRLDEERRLLARQVSETLRIALVQIIDLTGLDWKAVGLNAFLIERPWGWRAEPYLRRIGRERISIHPLPSEVRWTKGKGVIGRCWELNSDVGVDLAKHFAPYRALTEDEWDALTTDERFGLSYLEFKRTEHLGPVVATPIQEPDGTIIGVVSVDGPPGTYTRLSSEPVREAIGAAATTVRNLYE